MIFIAGNLLSGIGQVTDKYRELFDEDKVYSYTDPIPENQEVMLFALPLPDLFDTFKTIKRKSKNIVCMTVCETETVHPLYGELFEIFPRIIVPSEFCKTIFERQFGHVRCSVVRHWSPTHSPTLRSAQGEHTYTYYHIGNIMDPRKQTKRIIEAFLRLNLPNTKLVLKATCKQPVPMNLPRIEVINGLLPSSEIQRIHDRCDCYVSFSNSEGVGMGAVEAALNNKPVIITEYGGAKEYIHTPYVIPCTQKAVGMDDFLFTKDMIWGDPDFDTLMKFMKDVYDKQLRHQDHEYTKKLLRRETIIADFTESLRQSSL